MPFGVDQERLLAGEGGPYRTLQQPGGQRRLTLIRHVLLAAEGAPVRDQFGDDHLWVEVEDAGDVVSVVPDALPAGEHHQPIEVGGVAGPVGEGQRLPGRHRHRQGRLRLEEGVFDPLGLERLGHGVGRGGQAGLGVAPAIRRAGQDVTVELPDGVLIGFDVGHRVGHRRQHVVGDVDRRGGPTGGERIIGDDEGQDVAEVRGATADRNKDRPVLVNETGSELPGNVGRGDHARHAFHGFGGGGVDRQHVGSGVVGQPHRTVQEARWRHVVDVGPGSQGQRFGFVLDTTRADPLGTDRNGHLAGGQILDGVEDLDIAGAAAQVTPEEPGRILTLQVGALLVDHRLRAHHDARRAETALQCSVGGEGCGHRRRFGRIETLGGQHLGTVDLGHRRLTGDPGLAVDDDRTASALTGRSAPVLGRDDAEFVAEGGQQMLVIVGRRHRPAVEDEVGHVGAPRLRFGLCWACLCRRWLRRPKIVAG